MHRTHGSRVTAACAALEASDVELDPRTRAVAGSLGRQLEKKRAVGERCSGDREQEDGTGRGLLRDASALR